MGIRVRAGESSFVGIYFLVAACFALAFSWWSWQSANAVRTFQQRCSAELADLLNHLKRRHLVLSHLVDALGGPGREDLSEIMAACETAKDAIDVVDARNPETPELFRMAMCERDVAGLVEDLMEELGEQEVSGSVAACLDGLGEATKQITETGSAYNSSVITYLGYLESKVYFVRKLHGNVGHCVLDLDPPHSSDSRNESPIQSVP